MSESTKIAVKNLRTNAYQKCEHSDNSSNSLRHGMTHVHRARHESSVVIAATQ